MDSKHFLQKAKTSFQTYVTLTEQTEITQEIQRLIKMAEKGKKNFDLMCCDQCHEVSCECDHERMGDGSMDDERLPFGDPCLDDDGKAYGCQHEFNEDICMTCVHCITEQIGHPAGGLSLIDSQKCDEGYFDHP